MNAILALGLVFAGVKFSDLTNSSKKDLRISNIKPIEDPNGEDIYESRDYDKYQRDLFRRAYVRRQDSKHTSTTGMVPPLYNERMKDARTGDVVDVQETDRDASDLITQSSIANLIGSQKEPQATDFLGTELKIIDNVTNEEKFFKETQNDSSFIEQFKPMAFDNPKGPSASNAVNASINRMDMLTMERNMNLAQGYSSFNKNKNMTYNITPAQNFVHNNMVPFFPSKGSYGDNSGAYDYIKQRKVEEFTGSSNQVGVDHKREQGPRFDPVIGVNMTNIYGAPTVSGKEMDRYAMVLTDERKNQSEKPFQPIRVNVGLDLDYYTHGSDGYQPWYRPFDRGVDELRLANKPKISLGNVVIPGMMGQGKRGIQAPVNKNRPETFYENDPEDMLRTFGYVTAPTVRGNYYLKTTLKEQTMAPYAGNPYGQNGLTVDQNMPEYMFPKVKLADKNIYLNPGVRNIAKSNAYGTMRSNYQIGQNERSSTVFGTWTDKTGHMSNTNNWGFVVDPKDIPKTTMRQITENNKYLGILGPDFQQGRAYDPKDIPKTTLRQLTMNQDRAGNQLLGSMLGTVHYTDAPQATMRQIYELNQQTGNALGGISQNYGLGQYSTHWTAPTTMKQIYENAVQAGNGLSGISQYYGLGNYNTNWIAPVTIRQMQEQAIQAGNGLSGISQNYGLGQYNTKWTAPTTLRQIHELNTQAGNGLSGISQNYGLGQYSTKWTAPTTMKQIYENAVQAGNGLGGISQGYGLGLYNTKWIAPTTLRQTQENAIQAGNGLGGISQNYGLGQYSTHWTAPTTMKQIHENFEQVGVGLGGIVQNHGLGIYNTHWIAPTTLRQTQENSVQAGNGLGGISQNYGLGQYNTKWIAPTTMKQIYENAIQAGNGIGGISQNHGLGYTTQVWQAPTTLRQTQENAVQAGNVSGNLAQNKNGMESNKWYAPVTTKQGTTNIMYMGTQRNIMHDGGYQTNRYYAPPTVKQSTTNFMHIGGSAPNVYQMPRYETQYNGTTFDDRKEINNLTGRMPTLSNYEKTPDMNMTEVRLKSDENKIVYRDTMPERYTYNPSQQVLPGCFTEIPHHVYQESVRLDPVTTSSLLSNPYHIAINPVGCTPATAPSSVSFSKAGFQSYANPYSGPVNITPVYPQINEIPNNQQTIKYTEQGPSLKTTNPPNPSSYLLQMPETPFCQ